MPSQSPNQQCQSSEGCPAMTPHSAKSSLHSCSILQNVQSIFVLLGIWVTSDFTSPFGFYGVTFAHYDCDTVCNLPCLLAILCDCILECCINKGLSFLFPVEKLHILQSTWSCWWSRVQSGWCTTDTSGSTWYFKEYWNLSVVMWSHYPRCFQSYGKHPAEKQWDHSVASVFLGSVATCLRWGGELCMHLAARSIRIFVQQKLWHWLFSNKLL